MANRHGLVTGATGTGKTVTLQIMAEGFCRCGVPVFAADVKGDLSGICMEGEPKDFLIERAKTIGFDDYGFEATPTIFWDLFGEQGHPIRTTVTEMGPLHAVAPHGPLGCAGRRAQHRLQHCRQGRPRPSRSEGPAGTAEGTWRARQGDHHGVRQRQRTRPSAPSSAASWCWRSRAATTSSANPRSTSRTSCAPRRMAGLHERAGRRQADQLAAALCHLPAVADVGTLRAHAGSGRSREAADWCSSSTKRISSSPRRLQDCCRRSSRR